MTTESEDGDRFLDTEALAAALGISTRGVRRLMAEGRLPHYRVGRKLRFRLDEVSEALRVPAVPGQ